MKPVWLKAFGWLLLMAAGCETDTATSAQVDNAYLDRAGGTSVYEAWWVTTHFSRAVAAGASSQPQRTVPDTGYAYALLEPGFDPSSGSAPSRLVAVRSREPLRGKRGETLHIVVSDETFIGNCAAGSTLSNEDARLIVHSIFPGPFHGLAYEPSSCSSKPLVDAGVPAEDDAG
jgi:hypothetical protein